MKIRIALILGLLTITGNGWALGTPTDKLTLLCSTIFRGEGHLAQRGYVAKLSRGASEMPRASFVDSQGDFRIDSLLVNYMDLLRLEVRSPKLEEPDHVTVDLPLHGKELYQRTLVGDFGVRHWWNPNEEGEFKADTLEISCVAY